MSRWRRPAAVHGGEQDGAPCRLHAAWRFVLIPADEAATYRSMKTVFVLFCLFGMSCSDVVVAGGKDVRTERASEPRPKRPGKYPISIDRDGHGHVFVYRGQKYRSSEELLKNLDLRKYYDVEINYLDVDESILPQVKGLIGGGLKINFVKRAVNNGPPPRFVRVEDFLARH